MQNTETKPTSKSLWIEGRKLTTDTGKPISSFTMITEFYNSYVDRDTGEVKPGKWTYKGSKYLRDLKLRNIQCDTELDALLYWLHSIQLKCYRVTIFDNSIPGTGDAIIFTMEKGIIDKERNKLKSYSVMVKNLIPNYKLVPHK